MIMNDVGDMKGRVAKTDNNNGYGVLMVSARKPITNQQRQQPLSQTTAVKIKSPAVRTASTTKSWKELHSMIIQGA
jgi:hypothetical protein